MKKSGCIPGIIDFHTHIFPDKIAEKTISYLSAKADIPPYTDGTEAGLIRAMTFSDTIASVALPAITKPTQLESVNRFAEEVNERNTGRERMIISFAGIHPMCDDIDGKMKNIAKRGFKGVKIHPDYQGEYIDAPNYIRILECAREYGLIVVTHSGVDAGFPGEPVKCTPERLRRVLETIPYEKFVLAHYGALFMWDDVYRLITDYNVYFDTAYMLSVIPRDMFMKIMNKIGTDKILFATDSPWRDIKEETEKLKAFSLGEEAERKIFYENAAKLLGIT